MHRRSRPARGQRGPRLQPRSLRSAPARGPRSPAAPRPRGPGVPPTPGRAAASRALPFPRRKQRAPPRGRPGPTSCAGGRVPGHRGPAPPPPRPGGARVKRAGAGLRRAGRGGAGGEGAAAGGGSGGGGAGRGGAGGGRGRAPEVVGRWAGGRRVAGGGRAAAAGGAGRGWGSLRGGSRAQGAGPAGRCAPAAMAFRRRTKSYPLFSQEFVIHNHADIGFCVVLCVLIGLMFEVTAKTAFLFILPQYNISVPTADGETVHYHYGPKDLVTILFYVFITIILHAVVQEYILDKISKRLHLSKVKHSKFNESGQLVIFHLSSVIWCFYVVVTEGYLTNPRSLWEDYPHVYLPFQVKFFYLCQLAYWLHALPELYFQKVRKEEIPRQLQYICLYLVHIAGAYLLNLSRLGLILLLLQYSTEFLFHMARLFYFADENNEKLFNAWAAVFGITRLFILTLAVLAIGFGLARMENQAFDPEKGNFNTLLCRLCVLLLVCAAQAWLMWRFIHSQLRHWREYWNEQSAKRRVPAAPRLPARLIKRESGYHENGVVKAENGTSPRTKKLKSP
uniref:Translocation associated membrane protein 2 n=1 Tax=Canis lupus familiaris TaxID=9615 RepID=A0A8C0P484_CANLF